MDMSVFETGLFSGGYPWKQEYYKDSAVVRHATSFAESFADTSVVATFDLVVPGGIGTIQHNCNWNAIFHQYTTISAILGSLMIPGDWSANRVAMSPPVPMGNSPSGGSNGPKPHVSPSVDVGVIPVDATPVPMPDVSLGANATAVPVPTAIPVPPGEPKMTPVEEVEVETQL